MSDKYACHPNEETYKIMADLLTVGGAYEECIEVSTFYLDNPEYVPCAEIYTPYIFCLFATGGFEDAAQLLRDNNVKTQIIHSRLSRYFEGMPDYLKEDVFSLSIPNLEPFEDCSIYYSFWLLNNHFDSNPKRILSSLERKGILAPHVLYCYLNTRPIASVKDVTNLFELINDMKKIDPVTLHQLVLSIKPKIKPSRNSLYEELYAIIKKNELEVLPKTNEIVFNVLFADGIVSGMNHIGSIDYEGLWNLFDTRNCEKLITQAYNNFEEEAGPLVVGVIMNSYVIIDTEHAFMALELLHDTNDEHNFERFFDYCIRKSIINNTHVQSIINMMRDLERDGRNEAIMNVHNMLSFTVKPPLFEYWQVLLRCSKDLVDLCQMTQESLQVLPKTVDNVKSVTYLFMEEMEKKSPAEFLLHRHIIHYLKEIDITQDYLDTFYTLVRIARQ